MRKLIASFFLVVCISLNGQIAHYNQYPTMYVDNFIGITGASFAFSLRTLNESYTGPLVKLRRDSDNATKDFYSGGNDVLDVTAIATWAGTSNVFVDTWYDQSTHTRNATQTSTFQQPALIYSNPDMPEIKFDGVNDYLRVINGNLQSVTNAGKEGTVFTVARATKKNQNSFGLVSGSDRWSVHLSWGNNSTYFDPGHCCNTIRSFDNTANENLMKQYTFIARSNSQLVRVNQQDVINSSTDGISCTRDWEFLIGAGSTSIYGYGGNSSNSFVEMIMYPTDVNATVYEEMEMNQMNFWPEN